MKIRCSALGRVMTDPKTKSEGVLSAGAKTYIRELAASDIFGVDFGVSSKYLSKGIECEQESIDLFNRVWGLDLSKNTERVSTDYLTGECDLVDQTMRKGWDIKTSWSLQTFPLLSQDAVDKSYEWQMRGYMHLYDCDEWEVVYCMVDTPESLIGYEPLALHLVSHIPESHRVTTWLIERDLQAEEKLRQKCQAAQVYYAEVVAEFHRTHNVVL